MNSLTQILLSLMLFVNLLLASSSRIRPMIKCVAFSGALVGLMMIAMGHHYTIGVITILVKAIALPLLIAYAGRKASVQREIEPLVGYGASIVIVFLFTVVSGILASGVRGAPALPITAALATILTGLFLICARKKALTQVAGFVVFENGIGIFGSSVAVENSLIIELGILLDVFVLVFIFGIAIWQINKTFSSIDTDKLNHLGDNHLLKGGHHE